MEFKVPESALHVIRGTSPDGTGLPGSVSLERAQQTIMDRTNPDVVARRSINPFSVEYRARREAMQEAVKGRLQIFRDNIEAVTKTNRILNNAAIIRVMTAAENWIVDVRSGAEIEKHAILDRRQSDLLRELREHLEEVKALGGDPEFAKIVCARMEAAVNEYAQRSLKLAGLDFEFDKKRLLQLAA